MMRDYIYHAIERFRAFAPSLHIANSDMFLEAAHACLHAWPYDFYFMSHAPVLMPCHGRIDAGALGPAVTGDFALPQLE